MAPRPEGSPRLSHRLEAVLLAVVAAVAGLLPERLAQGMGSALGWLAGSVLRIRRGVVEENLRRAFPDRDPRWIRRTASAHYRHLAREAISLLLLPRRDRDELLERTRVTGLEALEEACREAGGALLLTGHLGNWEMGGAAVAIRGVPLDVVARRQSNPLFDDRLNRTRRRLGMEVLFREEATRPLLKGLRSGRAAALVADQNQREGGIFVDFFGVPASTTRGPAVMARRTGVPVFVAICLREPGARARYHLDIRPLPLPDVGTGEGTAGESAGVGAGPDRKADEEAFDAAFLRRYMAALEEAIRLDPPQYFWGHRRWKTRPPGEGGEPGPVPGDASPHRGPDTGGSGTTK
ncbi:MAG: hypothetical protein EA352_07910 [Gemmatimonadales bacterium]|nr:MAG: hypothetical protein EA352_07910 [Gemmatimonadales bacterium]